LCFWIFLNEYVNEWGKLLGWTWRHAWWQYWRNFNKRTSLAAIILYLECIFLKSLHHACPCPALNVKELIHATNQNDLLRTRIKINLVLSGRERGICRSWLKINKRDQHACTWLPRAHRVSRRWQFSTLSPRLTNETNSC
jgi:hypothetical protein